MSSRSTFIGAVEIGTSKICVLVAEHSGSEVAIIGRGECASRGVIKGAVVDFKAASECAHAALEQAERQAGEKIEEVFLAQTGGHLEGFYNEAAVSVKAADNLIDHSDVRTVCDLALLRDLPFGRTVVHNIRRPFRVDGRMIPGSPVNLVGQRLEVGYWTVHGQEQRLADTINVIKGFNLNVREIVLASLASGYVVTSPEERQHGVLVIDVGGGTTDFALYRDGCAHTTGVLPVGGAHITNDLSIGLRLTQAQAEKLKLRHGRATVQTKDKAQKVWLDGNFAIGDRQFSQQAIEQIVAARIEETLQVVRQRLGAAFRPETCAAGVVLTGGTARLPGIAEVAARVFGVPAHLGEPPVWVAENLREPGHHTALGVLYCGIKAQAEHGQSARRGRGFFSSLRELFTHA
ncbi:MAG: cell division protein FtsA [Opitutaceae bacterium]|nr:cell division protein FtsA [Opitutaceae bacterium]